MRSFFNDAIIGNGNILACFNKKGLLQRLFWPEIDFMQQIEYYKMGIGFDHMGWDTIWMEGSDFQSKQSYVEDAPVLRTSLRNDKIGIDIQMDDFVIWDNDIYLKDLKVTNIGPYDTYLSLIVHVKFKSSVDIPCGVLFDKTRDTAVFTRREGYMSLGSSAEVCDFIVGNHLVERATKRKFDIIDSVSMGSEVVLKYELGLMKSNDCKEVALCHSFAKKMNELASFKKINMSDSKEKVIKDWNRFYGELKEVKTASKPYNTLYKNSVLIFRLLSNKQNGAMIAAPEMDEEHSKCGGYGYCWCRDAVFIAQAMELCKMHEEVEQFYLWAKNVQHQDGYWHQRYSTSGDIATSWGLQIDETGTMLWGILKHYEATEKKEFLVKMWPCIKNAVSFLLKFIHIENKLPHLSFDLWEERLGQHAYSSAAVCAGLFAAAKISEIVQGENEEAVNWKIAANNIKSLMEQWFWDNEERSFIRSIHVRLNAFGKEPSKDTNITSQFGQKKQFEVSKKDVITDISLLGLCVPFEIFEYNDPRMIATVKRMEERLNVSGGYKRYENDHYMSGAPWVIATLWMALYYEKAGLMDRSLELFKLSAQTCTELGYLPEQFDPKTLKASWVLPLNWSHAMYVICLFKLIDRELL